MRRRSPCVRVLLALALLVLPSEEIFAQSTTGETGLSPRQLMIRLTSAAGTGTGVANIGEVIADLIGLDVSTAPLGSSAGGFTFTFDPLTRSFRRAAPSFGPMFGERAITSGEGRANFGINFIRTSYDTLDGVDLRDGSLSTAVMYAGSTPLYSGTVDLDAATSTVVFFGNIALNEWFDLGLAVPHVRLEMTGRHQIGDEVTTGAASASGMGDVAVRAKIRAYSRGQGGIALGIDARLPTGDKEALLGAGIARTLVSGIWSGTFGRLVPHVSTGFEYWSGHFEVYDPLERSVVDAGRHAMAYTAGVEWVASDRLTVNAELVGRRIADGGRLSYRSLPFRGNPFGITSASIASIEPRGLTQGAAAAGIKWNFAGSALLTASLLTPIDDSGLRDRLTPIVGLDWGF